MLEGITGMGKKREGSVPVVGRAKFIGDFVDESPIPKSLKFVMDNTGGEQAKTYIVGDAFSALKGALKDGGSMNELAPEGVGIGAFKKYLQSCPIVLDYMRCEAKESSSQFENDVQVYDWDLDGVGKAQKIALNEGVTGEQFNSKIQAYKGLISFGPRRGFVFNVNKGEKLIVTMYIHSILNRV